MDTSERHQDLCLEQLESEALLGELKAASGRGKKMTSWSLDWREKNQEPPIFDGEKTMVSCNPSTNPVGWGCRWIFVTFRKAGGQFTIFPWTVWFYGDENDERTIYRPWYAVVMQLAIGLGNPTLCHDGKSTWKLLAKHPEMDHFPLGTLVKNQRVNFRVNRRWKPHMI